MIVDEDDYQLLVSSIDWKNLENKYQDSLVRIQKLETEKKELSNKLVDLEMKVLKYNQS